MNMALKTTINEARPTTLTREIMRMLSDICDELNRYGDRVSEMLLASGLTGLPLERIHES